MTIKTATLSIRSIDTNARRCSCVASTDTLDSYGERVDQTSWDLTAYRSSPVVLYAHDTRSLPIGKAEHVRVEGGALQADIVFASAEANPEAEKVWRLVQEKILNGVSVGFRPGRVTYSKENGKDVATLHDCVLRELSVVPVGANPDALIRSRDGTPAPALRAAKTTVVDYWQRPDQTDAERAEDARITAEIVAMGSTAPPDPRAALLAKQKAERAVPIVVDKAVALWGKL